MAVDHKEYEEKLRELLDKRVDALNRISEAEREIAEIQEGSYDLARKYNAEISKWTNIAKDRRNLEKELIEKKTEQTRQLDRQIVSIRSLHAEHKRLKIEEFARAHAVFETNAAHIASKNDLADSVEQLAKYEEKISRRRESLQATRMGMTRGEIQLELIRINRMKDAARVLQSEVTRKKGIEESNKITADQARQALELAAKNSQETRNSLLVKGQEHRIGLRNLESINSALASNRRGIRVAEQHINSAKKYKEILDGVDGLMGKSTESWGKLKSFVMDITSGNGLKMLKALIQTSLDRWLELDKAAEDFRKKTGLIVGQTQKLDKAAREVNNELMRFGVNLKEAYEATADLYDSFQTTVLVTKEMVASSAMLAANLGLGSKDVAQFKSMFTSIAESAGTTADGIIAASAALARLGGVAPSAVMKDMATASGATLSFLAKSPMALMKASVEARRMGTSLKSISDSARGLLNFQDSITAEMEASALLGKNVNFQLARQLAFEGDVVGSRKVALEQVRKLGDFTKMNVYQQEALAKASGMTVDEILKQQNQQKMLDAVKSSGRAEDISAIKAYEAALAPVEKTQAQIQTDLEKQGREMMKQRLMQAEMTKLANAIDDAWNQIRDSLLPIANGIMPIFLFTARATMLVFRVIGAVIRGILAPLESVAKRFRMGEEGAAKMEKILENMSKAIDSWVPAIETFSRRLGKILIPLMSILKIFNLTRQAANMVGSVWNWVLRRINAELRVLGKLWDVAVHFITKGYTVIQKFSQNIMGGVTNLKKMSLVLHDIGNLFRTTGTHLKDIGGVFKLLGYLINRFGRSIVWVATKFTAMNNIAAGASRTASLFSAMGTAIGFVLKPLQFVSKLIVGIGSLLGAVFGRIPTIINWVSGIGSAFSSVFGAASKLSFLGKIFMPFISKLPIIGWVISAIQVGIDLFGQWMDIWSDDSTSLGEKILQSLAAIPTAIWNCLVQPFIDGIDWVLKKMGVDFSLSEVLGEMYNSFIGFGSKIFEGIFSIGGLIVDALVWAFSNAWKLISMLWGGNSPSELGLSIVKGIASVGGMIMDFLVSPFKSAWELIKKIPFVDKLFGGAKDAAAQVSGQIKTSVEAATTAVVEIKNLDEMKEAVKQLTEAVTRLGGAAGAASPIMTTNVSNSEVVSKLDELIGLMRAGAIAVNLDGRKVSSAMSATGRD